MLIANKNLRLFLPTVALVLLVSCNVQRDKVDAEVAASRIHSHLQNDDFISIYREAGQSFKKVGDESRFLFHMKKIREENGPLKNVTKVSYQTGFDTNAGANHLLIFNLEFERGRARERMTLTKSKTGQMELWDLAIDPTP